MRDTVSGGGINLAVDGTWSINGDYLTLNFPGFGSGVARLPELTSTSMIFQDTSDTPDEFTIYTKQ